MYYIVNEQGQVVGPYSADWIRSNVQSDTQVSYQQNWLPYSSHPDFQTQAVRPKTGETKEFASQSNLQLWRKSGIYLAIGITCCTLLLLATESIGPGTSTGVIKTLQIPLIWIVVLGVMLLQAYVLGLLFGGRARLSTVFFGFARSVAAIYVILPLSLFLYIAWFQQLWQSHTAIALLVILLFMFIVPAICIVLAFIGVRVFVKSMVFGARWRAWATTIFSAILITIEFLLLGDWFAWFKDFLNRG